MAIYSPELNVPQFELRGESKGLYNQSQRSSVEGLKVRVPSQLNWLAQLLGWSGANYWDSFNATIDQKRQLLGGSFGVYNGFIYPEISEVRNWSNQVVIKDSPYISDGQTFYLGNFSYLPVSVEKSGDFIVVSFSELSSQFLSDLAAGEQLRVIAPKAMPSPFVRNDVKASGDRRFLCKVELGSITLYPSFDTEKTIPYRYCTFFLGSRYYFDLPVKLIISDDYYIAPTYDFDSESWYLDIPCELSEKNTELSARLDYNGSFLIISILLWSDPSDWVDKDKLELFTGVWGNKGGMLPFNFTFDSLSLHGFDEKKSLYLEPISRSVDFDILLNEVYQQSTQIDSLPPPISKKNQVWWNSQTGKFSIHVDDNLNCGPWVEAIYPPPFEQEESPDYIFPNTFDFRSYTGEFTEGDIIQIVNCAGLDFSDNVVNLLFQLVSPAQVVMFKPKGGQGWVAIQFIYQNVGDFDADAPYLPPSVKVDILDSDNLSPSGSGYEMGNLSISVSGNYRTSLMKHGVNGLWFLSPPSELKYIGNTRLFQSSLDYNNPVEGEMLWDFGNPDVTTRTAAIFYYNRWEFNIVTNEWELKGDWVSINGGTLTSPPPTVVEFGAILVYCDGQLLTENVNLLKENYQVSYSVNPLTGKFNFNYLARNYEGMVRFPKITLSDSLTTSFVSDVTSLVFSGLQYYMSPNVVDSETLLRVWKDQPLFCVDSPSDYAKLNYPNGLIADQNSGPQDINWDRFFIRLAPTYQRYGSEWQKVNLVCQDFSYWGSPSYPEDMSCPAQESKPEIYEEVYVLKMGLSPSKLVYCEPYLYSTALPYFTDSGDYSNASLLPSFDLPNDTFTEAEVINYEPLHERRASTSLPMGRGYGDWEGDYYRISECSYLSGHLVNDISAEVLEPSQPPVWDSSIYKYPQTCLLDQESGQVDANHYKVGYAFFAADLSAAEEAIYNFS